MKSDPRIVPDLPDKTEMTVSCGLSKKQVVLYEKVTADVSRMLESADGIQRKGLVLSLLMRLKQLCNHPDQFLGQPGFEPGESGKFQVLRQICETIREQQGKVLVFTQFQTLCDPLAAYLSTLFQKPGLVLHGEVPVKQRRELVTKFQEREDLPFFVISLKAGGSGLNLTAASHVIHFDRWWNPAVENQATDRAYRIGQKRNVLVHKLVCRGTLEERIDQTLRDKQELADDILQEGGEKLLTEMSDDELLQFVSLDVTRATDDD
jgi:non-specific serine/threonine protein kinase